MALRTLNPLYKSIMGEAAYFNDQQLNAALATPGGFSPYGIQTTAGIWKAYTQYKAFIEFGPQAPRNAPDLVGSGARYEKTALGETVRSGAFITGPNIKRLTVGDLMAAGRLPLYTVSSISDAMPGGGTTGVEGLGVVQAGPLTITEIQNLRDIAYAGAVYDVPKLISPLTSFSRPGYTVPNVLARESENIPQFQKNYQSYIQTLPFATKTAIQAYKPGTASGLATSLLSSSSLDTRRESNYAIQNAGGLGTGQTTGSFALDVQAQIATIPYQTQVIAATKVVTTPAAKELVSLPMPSYYQPAGPNLGDFALGKLQAEGPLKVQTVSLPTLSTQQLQTIKPKAVTDPGSVYYATIRDLAGQIKDDKLVYNTKKYGTVKFDLYSPKPTLLPR